jgi:O-antigen/teichoic acid export membrane protein
MLNRARCNPVCGGDDDPMTSGSEKATIHANARRGIKLMLSRQVAILVFTFLTGVALARLLGPAQFGAYAIALFLVELFALFGNFGLAASFVQRRSDLTQRDLTVGFTLQQIVISVLAVSLFVVAPWLVTLFPKAPSNSDWLVRALAVTLYLTSWRSMSALQLERGLEYSRLAWVEVVEVVTFQSVALALAALHYGVWSLVAAALVRASLGVMLLFFAAPWPIRFAFDKGIAREIIRFGVPFQLQQAVNSAGSWTTPLLVGSIIGPRGVGLVTFASSNGRKPLLLVDNVMRVAFPHFSRIQDDRDEVERILARYLTYLLLPAALWSAVLMTAGPSLVTAIYSSKWSDASLALILFGFALMPDVVQWVLGVTLNSTGSVRSVTRIVFFRSGLQIVLTVPLVLVIGFNAVPIAYLVSAVVVVPWLVRLLRPGVGRHLVLQLRWIGIPFAAAVAGGASLLLVPLPMGVRAAAVTAVASLLFVAVAWVAKPSWLTASLKDISTPTLQSEPEHAGAFN